MTPTDKQGIPQFSVQAAELFSLFLQVIYFYICKKYMIEKEEIDILYHVNSHIL